METHLIYLIICIHVCVCDFYVGMFKQYDLLVAQDTLYKERLPFRSVYAKYGRIFKCPITYFRVVDRLGIGRGPKVEIIRGGLRQKYLVLRLKSPYNYPISTNIYVGCENKIKTPERISPLPEPSEDATIVDKTSTAEHLDVTTLATEATT